MRPGNRDSAGLSGSQALSFFDVAVVGTGAAGLSCALALSRDGVRVALVGADGPLPDGRTVALLDGSVRLLRALRVWDAIAPMAAPLAELHIVDDTGSLFRPPPARFQAGEIGLDAFGWNVENTRLVEGLRAAARQAGTITAFSSNATGFEAGEAEAALRLEDGRALTARLVVGADGARSRLRSASGIASRAWSYPQAALTTILAHDAPHRDVSTEFHTRQGPFTLVPLPGGHRSSLVWMQREAEAERVFRLDDADLAEVIRQRANGIFGSVRIDGPRGLVPMRGLSVSLPVGKRLALIGEAAHVFPPIGAQGLNLGLRDAAALRDAVRDALRDGRDPGSSDALAGFGRGRRFDAGMRGRAVDLLNRSLLADLLPVDALRGLGLLALASIGPLRRAVMREGVVPRLGAPELMRAR